MDSVFRHEMNEELAAKAFSRQAVRFDSLYGEDGIIRYKRQRVRELVLRRLPAGGRILELNAGTGEDALFFARAGYRVHGTDLSEGMLDVLREKAAADPGGERITTESCSFTALDMLQDQGPYDLVFSNFAGLNCTGELEKVLARFSSLLKPGGQVVLVLLPPFCLWESLLLFRGKFRTATRRWFSGRGAASHVEGVYFRCWYYRPSFVVRQLRGAFDLAGTEGLCTIVPPSYLEHFAERYPGIFRWLRGLEERWKESWPWRTIGDYYIISLRKN